MKRTKNFFSGKFVNISFECKALTLRKFDGRQYADITSVFPFESDTPPLFNEQTSFDFQGVPPSMTFI